MNYPNPCKAEFDRLLKEAPATLLSWVQSGTLEPHDLTFALECLGHYHAALPVLVRMLSHDSALVREGALHGLYNIKNSLDWRIDEMSESDPSPGVRSVAKTILRRFS